MPAAVVADAGPLIALAKLNALHLLTQLYDKVHLPSAVYQEAVIEGIRCGYDDAHTLARLLRQEKWEPTEVIAIPTDLALAPLDQGEKEAIALAARLDGLLLIDDEHGRQEARRRGIAVRGTLGVLIEAYRRSLVAASQLRLYFTAIEERTDIWISPVLCQQLLQQVLGDPESD